MPRRVSNTSIHMYVVYMYAYLYAYSPTYAIRYMVEAFIYCLPSALTQRLPQQHNGCSCRVVNVCVDLWHIASVWFAIMKQIAASIVVDSCNLINSLLLWQGGYRGVEKSEAKALVKANVIFNILFLFYCSRRSTIGIPLVIDLPTFWRLWRLQRYFEWNYATLVVRE